jgi:PBSX family phage terminase large subunit
MKNNLRKLYTRKQIAALKCFKKNFWLLVLHGAKRAGKTVADNDLFLLELKRVRKIADRLNIPEPQYILAGNSLGSIARNVLIELTNKYGIEINFNKHNEFKLFGVKVCCFGHGTIRDMARIRGMTSFGAYINEGTTAVEEVVREILNRCSGEGARVMMDTNPDNPEHYIKTDYIDKADNNKIIEIHFELDDNDFLTDEYKENIKSTTPTGLFYDRDILGLWVNSEGVVYKDFNKSMILTRYNKQNIIKYFAGVDWGYEHLGSIAVIGVDGLGNHLLVKEIVAQYEEIDYWVQQAKEVVKEFGNIDFYCDSARPEHVARFSREGFKAHNANKEVLSGIEVVAQLMKTNKFYVLDSCSHFKKEIYNYVWDKSKGVPVKANDDLLDALRYAIYSESSKQKSFERWTGKEWGNYLDKGVK